MGVLIHIQALKNPVLPHISQTDAADRGEIEFCVYSAANLSH